MLQFSLYAEVKQYMERGVYLENADRDRKRIVRHSSKKLLCRGSRKKYHCLLMYYLFCN